MKVFALILFCLVLCGCGPKEGWVVGREFTPAHDDTYYTTYKIGDSYFLMPNTVHTPDAWCLVISDGTNQASRSCTENEYKEVTNGAYWGVGVGVMPEPGLEK